MARVRHVRDEREMEEVIEDFATRGFRIKDRGKKSTMVKKKNWGSGGGHIAVAALTVWWTLGLGNVAYALYKYLTADEVQIKIDEDRGEE